MRVHWLALMLISLIALSACGDDESSEQMLEDTTEQQGPVAEEPEETTMRERFEGYLQDMHQSTWMVGYDGTIMTTPGEKNEVTFIAFSEGDDRYRLDRIGGVETRTYILDGTTTVCVGPGEWMCFGEEALLHDAIYLMESNIERGFFSVEASEERTIAGASTECFSITFEDSGSGGYCFTSDGMPLFVSAVVGELESERLAVEFESDVWDDAWDLPVAE